MILDYPDAPNMVTSVFIREWEESKVRRRSCDDRQGNQNNVIARREPQSRNAVSRR